jgi:DNA-binding CsgD family transcriptional regulator/PAS domain-containing protein
MTGVPEAAVAEAASTLFQGMPYPSSVSDDERRLTDVNDAFVKFSKYTRDALVGRLFDDLIAEPMASSVKEGWEILGLIGARTATTVFALGDGSTRSVRYTAVRNVAPHRHLAVIFPDYTVAPSKGWLDSAAEGELARIARLRDFFQTTAVPMVLADDERNLVDANSTALLGLPLEELQQLRIDDVWRTDAGRSLPVEWERFVHNGSQVGDVVVEPRATLIRYVAIANIVPGHHLAMLFRQTRDSADAPPLLTPREREVLGLVALGETLGSIGERLTLTHGTVRDHARSARAKLRARTLAQATAVAIRDGHIQI